MKANVTIRKWLLFYRVLTIASMVSSASVISVTATAQSQKAQQVVKQLNELVKESRCISKVLKRCTLTEGVLFIHSKSGERFGYDLRLVQYVRVQKGHNEIPFYKDTYELFLEFDYAVSNYTAFGGILKEQDAVHLKKALEHLVDQIKAESID